MSTIDKIKSKFRFQTKTSISTESVDIVMIDLDEVKKGTPFVQLFPIKPDVLAGITKDMKENGYDNSQPVIIWKETNLLVDGHTRTKAAKQADIKQVAAVYYSFEDVDSALKYAYGLQFKRRNIDDSDRFSFAREYLNNVVQGTKKSGWKKRELAEILSVSMSTAQKYLSVINRASDKDKQSVVDGEMSINNAYKRLLNKEGGSKKKNVRGSVTETKVDKEAEWCSKLELKGLIYINTELIKEKVDKWAKSKTCYDRIIAIQEILPIKSDIANYVKNKINKEC